MCLRITESHAKGMSASFLLTRRVKLVWIKKLFDYNVFSSPLVKPLNSLKSYLVMDRWYTEIVMKKDGSRLPDPHALCSWIPAQRLIRHFLKTEYVHFALRNDNGILLLPIRRWEKETGKEEGEAQLAGSALGKGMVGLQT